LFRLLLSASISTAINAAFMIMVVVTTMVIL
jgi:hypothetical protein